MIWTWTTALRKYGTFSQRQWPTYHSDFNIKDVHMYHNFFTHFLSLRNSCQDWGQRCTCPCTGLRDGVRVCCWDHRRHRQLLCAGHPPLPEVSNLFVLATNLYQNWATFAVKVGDCENVDTSHLVLKRHSSWWSFRMEASFLVKHVWRVNSIVWFLQRHLESFNRVEALKVPTNPLINNFYNTFAFYIEVSWIYWQLFSINTNFWSIEAYKWNTICVRATNYLGLHVLSYYITKVLLKPISST